MEEIWKDISGYEGLYQVSNLGRIKSFDRIVVNGEFTYPKKGRILKNVVCGHGYSYAVLSKNGVAIRYAVHRLVAQAFIPNPENKPCINHIDGNKINNDANNLEWATYSENNIHAYKIGLKKPPYNMLGKKMSEEHKRKIGEANRKRHLQKVGGYSQGFMKFVDSQD